MIDQLIQTSNPAVDLYRYFTEIIRYGALETLTGGGDAGWYTIRPYGSYRNVGLEVMLQSGNRRPVITVSRRLSLWPDGSFRIQKGLTPGRYAKHELDTLAGLSFIQWTRVGRTPCLYIPRYRSARGAYAYRTGGLDSTDWNVRQPYLPLDRNAAPLFTSWVKYRLISGDGLGIWKIQTIDRDAAGRVSQEDLDRRYRIAEARYARHQRSFEIGEMIHEGLTPSQASKFRPVDMSEMVSLFAAHTTIYEPLFNDKKNFQLSLLTRKEVVSNA